MENEVKEKPEAAKKRRSVGMAIKDIPSSVHNKLKKYRAKINYERNESLSLSDAYREFLIEKTK